MFKTVALVLLSITTIIVPGFAQNPRGSLRGAVQDASGARIPSAKVTVQSADAAMVREAQSEDRGEFRVDDLAPGKYQVMVTAAGFAEARASVSILVSSVREVTVTLTPVGARESVNVKRTSIVDHDATD